MAEYQPETAAPAVGKWNESLDYPILKEVDRAAASDELPLDMRDHPSINTQKDVEYVLRQLEGHKILMILKMTEQTYKLTVEGSTALRKGFTIRSKILEAIEQTPGCACGQLLEMLKDMFSGPEIENTLRELCKTNIIRKSTSKGTRQGSYTVADNVTIHDEIKFLEEIEKTGVAIGGNQLRDTLFKLQYVERVSNHWFLVNPGVEFEKDISSRGIDFTVPRKYPSLKLPALTVPADPDFYTKLKLLSHIRKATPGPTMDGYETSFIDGTDDSIPNRLPMQQAMQVYLNYPISTGLALLLVSDAENVAAITFVHPKPGLIRVVAAKNQITKKDREHVMRLVGLCYGDLYSRFGGSVEKFLLAGLKIIIPFCMGKIRCRLEQFLGQQEYKDILSELQRVRNCPDPENWARNDEYARTLKKSQTLRDYLYETFKSWKNTSVDDIFVYTELKKVLITCWLIYHSDAVKDIVHQLHLHRDALSAFLGNIAKIAEYCWTLGLLWRGLCCRKEASGRRSPKIFRIDFQLLDSPKQLEVRIDPDWYRIVRDLINHGSHFSAQEIRKCDKAFLMDTWKLHDSLSPDTLHVPYHCELQIMDYLHTFGLRRGFIGVSKHCCQHCTFIIDDYNSKGEQWKTASLIRGYENTQRDLEPGLVPNDEAQQRELLRKVDHGLRWELRKLSNEYIFEDYLLPPLLSLDLDLGFSSGVEGDDE